ncbi:hypothetical protein Tco_1301384 [Tanacetum coccineum]
MSIQDIEDLKQQYLDEMKTLIYEKDYRGRRIDIKIKINELKENFNEMSIEINKKKKLQQLEQVANLSTYPSRHFNSFCYDDDDDEEYTIAITPEKPVDSLIMEDEHLDTISEMESDEFIKSSVENLVPTPSESEDFSDIKSECDVPDCNDSQTTNFLTFSNPLFDDSTSSDDESSHEEGDILFLESLLYDNSSPRPPEAFQDNSNTIIESFQFPILVEVVTILGKRFDIFPDSTINVVEDIPVDVPNIFPTHPALLMDFGFIPSHNDLGSDPDVSSPSGDRNKIYDPGICIEVESMRFLAPLSPVIDTLLPFSSENEDKVFNHGVLAYKEKSPPSSSHRGLKAFQLSPESPMLIHADNTPNLGVRHPHFYPP